MELYIMMLSLVVGLVRSQTCNPPTASPSTTEQYALQSPDTSTLNYAYLGAVFAVHKPGSSLYECGDISPEAIQQTEAFLWALRTFKDRYPDNVLKDVDMGGLVIDTCSESSKAVQRVVNFASCVVGYGDPVVEPNRLLAWVGPGSETDADSLVTLMDELKKPLISPIISWDSVEQPDISNTVMKTVPGNMEPIYAMAAALKPQEWNFVQVVYSDDDYGTMAFDIFTEAVNDQDICIVNSVPVSKPYTVDDLYDIIDSLTMNSMTRAVALLLNEDDTRQFLLAVSNVGARGYFSWIGTDQWGTNSSIVQGVENVAEGAITVTLEKPSAMEFGEYFQQLKPGDSVNNPWFDDYWMQTFQCDLPGKPVKYSLDCNVDQQSLTSITMDDSIVYVIKAVDAAVNGIEVARAQQCLGTELCTSFINSDNNFKIQNAIRQVDVPGIKFDPITGDQIAAVININNYRSANNNCPDHCYVTVGQYVKSVGEAELSQYVFTYDSNGFRMQDPTSTCPLTPCTVCGEEPLPMTTSAADITTNSSMNNEMKDPTAPVEMREDKWVVVLLVLLGIGMLLVIAIEIFLLSKMFSSRYASHMRTMWLGQLLLFGVFLCYLTLFAFIPKPTKATCGILRFGIGTSFAMCFAVLLVKQMIILSSKKFGYLKGIFQMLMFMFAWGVQLAIDVVWLILREPNAIQDLDEGGWICKESFESHIISLVYVMFLILMTTIVAIKTHGIITNHREGVFIGLVSGFSIPIWLGWVLLGILNNDKQFQDPAMAFGLFITATLFIFTMFLPKVRQLNSMGVEGIYAEDDSPDGYAPSIIAPSVIANGGTLLRSSRPASVISPPSVVVSKPPPGSVVYVDNGNYQPPLQQLSSNFSMQGDSNKVYLLKPSNNSTLPTMRRTASLRSAPGASMSLARPKSNDSRVLKVTSDLTGRTYNAGSATPTARSEVGGPSHYGTASRSIRSSAGSMRSGYVRRYKSTQDLGSL